ncbi:MAG: hypothetical protein ABIA93_03900 [Candidatus Woesearchaeota archaeon]
MARTKKRTKAKETNQMKRSAAWTISALIIVAVLAIIYALSTASSCSGTGAEKDSCLLDNAITKLDPQECIHIQNEALQDTCYSEIGIVTNDLGVCDLTLRAQGKDACRVQIGMALNDSSACTGLTSNYWNDACMTYFVPITDDPWFCKSTRNMGKRDTCLYEMAKAHNDTNLCSYISLDQKGVCYVVLAAKLKNATICEDPEVPDVGTQDLCYLNVAISTNDKSYCDRISSAYLKQECNSKL